MEGGERDYNLIRSFLQFCTISNSQAIVQATSWDGGIHTSYPPLSRGDVQRMRNAVSEMLEQWTHSDSQLDLRIFVYHTSQQISPTGIRMLQENRQRDRQHSLRLDIHISNEMLQSGIRMLHQLRITDRLNGLHFRINHIHERIPRVLRMPLERSHINRLHGMRLDIDQMSYEELLELCERIGNAETGVGGDIIHAHMRQTPISSFLKDKPESCCICLEDYEKKDQVGKLHCGHTFHVECITTWLAQKNVCPLCQRSGIRTQHS